MKKAILLLLGAGVMGVATSAQAQSGFALKGHYLFNETTASDARDDREIPGNDGIGLGAEVVLPFGLGLGVSGYTAGGTRDVSYETTELTVLAEANYFLRLPLLPIAPYAGIHAGLGTLSRDDPPAELEIEDRSRTQWGYQLGARLQLNSLVGIDAQWRRMSTSAAQGQDNALERDQLLLGVTLF